MTKLIKSTAIIMLIMISVAANVFADSANANISDWAKDEVSKAAEINILPDSTFEDDLTRPITRAEFARFSVYFLAAQYNMEINDFMNTYFAVSDTEPNYEAFIDTDDVFVIWANALGIVSGYGDGTFRPTAYITRQEAAKMLLNVSKIFDNEIPLITHKYYEDNIADWAIDAVNTMYEWNVMGGVGDSRFDPLGNYTVEQSIVTFMRLYENAPMSRSHSNVEHFMTFEESLTEVLEAPFFRIYEQFDSEDYTIVYGEVTGVPHGPYSKLWIVYKNGGRQEILHLLPQKSPYGWQTSYDIQDMKLDDEDCTLTFTRSYEGEDYYYIIDIKSAKLIEASIP